MSQHSGLSPERWGSRSLDQQILMIGNEMNRASKLMAPGDGERLRNAYERALRLTDLTIQSNEKRTLRRELLRWRDLLAALYVTARPDPEAHAAAFRCLLRFTPEASRQIPFVVRDPTGGS